MSDADIGRDLLAVITAEDQSQARALIAQSAPLGVLDEELGGTPLHICEDPQTCRRLLEAGAEVDALSKHETTPLYWAAARPSGAAKVELLLAAGATVKSTASNGKTPLHSAAQAGMVDTARLLIEAGADVDARSTGGYYPGTTPFMEAAEGGHRDVLALLLANGAEVNAADTSEWNEGGRTALFLAVERGDPETVQWLLDNGADASATRNDGYTALDVADVYGAEDILDLLDAV